MRRRAILSGAFLCASDLFFLAFCFFNESSALFCTSRSAFPKPFVTLSEGSLLMWLSTIIRK